MRKFALVAIVVLAGCQMTANQKLIFDTTCASLTAAYGVYSQKHPGGKAAAAAWEIGSRVCTNPPLDLATATTQVALALYTISRLND